MTKSFEIVERRVFAVSTINAMVPTLIVPAVRKISNYLFGPEMLASECVDGLESGEFMSKKKASKNALADPTRLQPHADDDKETIQVIIETPKGSRNKFAFDDEQKVFELKKVLPAGMTFPHDFGFIPSTKAEDGDPVDVLVLMDEPAYPGCLIKCRPVGVIEGEEGKKRKWERNDRIVAIEMMNHTYAHAKHIDDLGKTFVKELADFFINYHELSGKQYRVLDVRGPGEARRRIKDGMRGANKK